ncbi:MAG: TolC family protein, partial [Candidatus Kryptoniota bacterium]
MQKIFVMIGVISFAVSVYGQAPLTLQDAIQIGLDNSKSLKISELNVEAAQEKSIEVNANRWASLAFKGGYTRLSTIPSFNLDIPADLFGPGFPPIPISYPITQNYYNYYNLQLQLQQPIFTGLQLENSAKAAERNAEASVYDSKADKSNLEVQIATAYWSFYNALQAKEFMQENLDRTNSHYTQAQDMMNQGMLTQSDVLSAKVQVSNSQLMLLNAENN